MLLLRSIHRRAALLASAILLFTCVLRAQTPTVAEQYLFAAINVERTSAGLPPLAWSGTLISAAHQHALRMGASGTLAHQLSGEPDLMERVSSDGTFFPLVTENIGEGPSSIDLHHDLMESSHHRENILDPEINVIGIAAVPCRGELWVVEDFAYKVQPVSHAGQEAKVMSLFRGEGAGSIQATARARTICQMKTGFAGPRPAFVMRYVASGLDRLPDEVNERMARGDISQVEVGACAPDRTGDFSVYNIAIVLYH